jgi:hypothetical protein
VGFIWIQERASGFQNNWQFVQQMAQVYFIRERFFTLKTFLLGKYKFKIIMKTYPRYIFLCAVG